jgi:hypothetical protein
MSIFMRYIREIAGVKIFSGQPTIKGRYSLNTRGMPRPGNDRGMPRVYLGIPIPIFKSQFTIPFLPACTYVQRGSKFCFVVVEDTLIKLRACIQFGILPLQFGILPMQFGILPLQFGILPLQYGDLPR